MKNEERIRELLKNAEKVDGISFIKWRIANREQIRKEKKEKLKELMTNETKQTAVIHIRNWVRTNGEISEDGQSITYSCNELEKVIEQAKEMEKEQHRKTYHQGLNSNFQDFEQYYNENYTK